MLQSCGGQAALNRDVESAVAALETFRGPGVGVRIFEEFASFVPVLRRAVGGVRDLERNPPSSIQLVFQVLGQVETIVMHRLSSVFFVRALPADLQG